MKHPASILSLITLVFLLLASCTHPQNLGDADTTADSLIAKKAKVSKTEMSDADTPKEAAMRKMGLIDIADIDSTIPVKLIYATADNFTGQVLYPDIRKAFFLPEVAGKIAKAQAQLKAEHPDLTLLIYDAARPLSVQQIMWKAAKATGNTRYVASPEKAHGLHNYGAAVDITLADLNGNPLPMGTQFDHFGEEAHTDHEAQLVADGKITQQELNNRRLLRRLMTDNGMLTIRTEWWHFEAMRGAQAKRQLRIIE